MLTHLPALPRRGYAACVAPLARHEYSCCTLDVLRTTRSSPRSLRRRECAGCLQLHCMRCWRIAPRCRRPCVACRGAVELAWLALRTRVPCYADCRGASRRSASLSAAPLQHTARCARVGCALLLRCKASQRAAPACRSRRAPRCSASLRFALHRVTRSAAGGSSFRCADGRMLLRGASSLPSLAPLALLASSSYLVVGLRASDRRRCSLAACSCTACYQCGNTQACVCAQVCVCMQLHCMHAAASAAVRRCRLRVARRSRQQAAGSSCRWQLRQEAAALTAACFLAPH